MANSEMSNKQLSNQKVKASNCLCTIMICEEKRVSVGVSEITNKPKQRKRKYSLWNRGRSDIYIEEDVWETPFAFTSRLSYPYHNQTGGCWQYRSCTEVISFFKSYFSCVIHVCRNGLPNFSEGCAAKSTRKLQQSFLKSNGVFLLPLD